LHKHDISIVNVENLITLPQLSAKTTNASALSCPKSYLYSKISRNLTPLFRDKITNFSINQVVANIFDELAILQLPYPPVKFKMFKKFLNPSLLTNVSEKLSSS